MLREESPCTACWEAEKEYQDRYATAPERVIRGRLHARAQQYAKSVVARRHKAEYVELYQAERARLLREAGLS